MTCVSRLVVVIGLIAAIAACAGGRAQRVNCSAHLVPINSAPALPKAEPAEDSSEGEAP
jgi:hypothetical protein